MSVCVWGGGGGGGEAALQVECHEYDRDVPQTTAVYLPHQQCFWRIIYFPPKTLRKCQPSIAEKQALNAGKRGPTGETTRFQVHLCQTQQKWPSRCQPRPFYSQAQTWPCCLYPLGAPTHLPISHPKDIAKSAIMTPAESLTTSYEVICLERVKQMAFKTATVCN